MVQANKTIEVFCSYAYNDEIWLHELETHLSLSKRQGLLTLWYPQLISPGINRQQVIDTHLETADVILLLVSADFLTSDYCYSVEMMRALERHRRGEAQVIPILIRQVDWKHAPFAHLCVLPTNAKPLATWEDKDAALANVATNLRRVLEGEPLPDAHTLHPEPSIWNVPHRRNPHFTGRDELLGQLHQQLTVTGQKETVKTRRAALTQPQAIKGLGGIGKTQIAVEYAYRSREQGHYTHMLWVNAASEETIITSFVTIAELLPSLPTKSEMDQRKLVEEVKRWLEQCEQRWLLIFDNVDDLSLIQEYLPQRGNGSVLLTTRANAVGSLAVSIEVEKMGLIEGTEFLLRRAQSSEHASEEEKNEATNIVITLDFFPLALDQAGAYIEETRCSFVDYLQAYQTRRKELLARRGLQTTNYPDSVATTWSLSFQKVRQANPAAAELLRLCAFLAPDTVPEELIRDGTAQWSPLLQQAATDPFTFSQMIAELLKFSLVKRLTETKVLSIHRLVQVVQKDMMGSEEQYHWAECTVRAINEVFPDNPEETATWPKCFRYLDQIQACDALIRQHTLSFIEAANVLNRAGRYLVVRHALYAVAEPLLEHALEIIEQQLGPQHSEAAKYMHDLAYLYVQQSRYELAEPLYRRALDILEEKLGPQHSETARCLNDLATLHYQQSKYELAEPLFRRALAIREQQLGLQHIDTATSLHDLARLYVQQGKYELAEPLYERALTIREQQLGPRHPYTARCLQSLAHLYFYQDKYDRAEPLYERALIIFEEQLGLQHPYIARCLNDLALLYTRQSKYDRAEPLYEHALTIREQQLGPQHPYTASSLHDLAELYTCQGKYDQAESLYERALTIREQQLGPRHPDTASSLHNMARLNVQQGKYDQAKSLYERAIGIFEEQLGIEHPWAQMVRRDNASLLLLMEHDKKAKNQERI